MKPAKKLSLPVWIFIGMLAGILAGLCFFEKSGFHNQLPQTHRHDLH